MSAIPVPDPTRRVKRIILTGDVPSPVNPPSGCSLPPPLLAARPPGRAAASAPTSSRALHPVAGDHVVACHFADRSTAERDRLTAGARTARSSAPLPDDRHRRRRPGDAHEPGRRRRREPHRPHRPRGRRASRRWRAAGRTTRRARSAAWAATWPTWAASRGTGSGAASEPRWRRTASRRARRGHRDPTTLALAELDARGAASYRFYVDSTAAAGPDRRGGRGRHRGRHAGAPRGHPGPRAGAHGRAPSPAGRGRPPALLVMVDPNCGPRSSATRRATGCAWMRAGARRRGQGPPTMRPGSHRAPTRRMGARRSRGGHARGPGDRGSATAWPW